MIHWLSNFVLKPRWRITSILLHSELWTENSSGLFYAATFFIMKSRRFLAYPQHFMCRILKMFQPPYTCITVSTLKTSILLKYIYLLFLLLQHSMIPYIYYKGFWYSRSFNFTYETRSFWPRQWYSFLVQIISFRFSRFIWSSLECAHI